MSGTSEGARKGWDTRGRGRHHFGGEIHPGRLYHATLTKYAASIRKQGLVPMKAPSNWVKAGDKSRYGNGEIFAFRARTDAVRWAAKMDWENNHKIGTGKVAIVVLREPKKGWVKDTADPFGQAGRRGNWLKKLGSVPRQHVRAVVPVSAAMIRKATARMR